METETWNVTPTLTYKIYNVYLVYKYLDSNQTAEIQGNDTMSVHGGKLEVDLTFSWSKSGSENATGTGSARGVSIPIGFSKNLTLDGHNHIEWQLI